MDVGRCMKRQKKCRVNNLPDEMLIAILSCLNFHEAARTSILSHRWRYLWKHTNCSLDFYNVNTSSIPLSKRFITSVNHVLKLHHSPFIHQFKLCFRCPILYAKEGEHHEIDYAIDAWINFAIRKQVKVFELDLEATKPARYDFFPDYSIPHVQHLLSISGGEVKLMTTLKTLKSLRFISVRVTQEVVEFILSNCPLLEHVCISASVSLWSLEVTQTLPNLKSMEICRCKYLTTLKVRAPNLVSFKYIGRSIMNEVPFEEVVPRLSHLTVGGYYACSFMMNVPMHSIYCSNLKRLKLEVSSTICSQCKVIPNEFHQLCHLKKLELDITTKFDDGLCFYLFLIKCAPHLSRLTIRLTFLPDVINIHRQAKAHAADRIVQEAMTFSHKCLKVVKLVGFIGSTSDYELASHLLRIAGSLKKMILCSDVVYYQFADYWPSSSMWKKAIRKCADQLKANLPPTAELLTYGPVYSKRKKLI